MRRTLALAASIGAIAAVSLALLVPTGAGAAQTTTTSPTTTKVPGIIDSVCLKLPDLLASVNAALPQADAALTTARSTVDLKRAAMTDAVTELATAVFNHLAALDAKSGTAATGAALKAKQAQYVETVVSWSKARTQLFDGEQQLVFGQLQQSLLGGVKATACP